MSLKAQNGKQATGMLISREIGLLLNIYLTTTGNMTRSSYIVISLVR